MLAFVSDASAASGRTPRESDGSPPGPDRVEASPPGTIPPGLQRRQEEPPAALIEPDGEALARVLDEAGRHEEAAALRADMQAQRQAAAARAAQLAEVRALLDDLPQFVMALPHLFGGVLTQMVAQAVVAALAQAPAKNGLQCSTCALNRAVWWHHNQADLQAAHHEACAAAGADPASPQGQALDFTAFLPEALRPGQPNGVPVVFDLVTFVNGSGYCPGHIPGAPGQQGGARLIAMPGMSVHAAAQLAMAGVPGMPGMPG